MFDDIEMLCPKLREGLEVVAMTAATLAPSQDDESLTAALVAVEQVRRAADAAQLAVLAELARRGAEVGPDGEPREVRMPAGEVADLAEDAVTVAIDCTGYEAATRCELAVRVADDLDPLLRPLMTGAVPERAVRLVADETREATPEGVAAVVAHVLAPKRGTETPRIEALDRHDLAQACRRVLDRTDPGWREERARRNRREVTDVRSHPGPVGTTEVVAVLPSEAAMVVTETVETLARQRQREQPGLRVGAARAQALTDLALRGVEVSTHITLGLALVQGPPDGSLDLVPVDGDDEQAPWVGGVEVPKVGWVPGSVVQTLVERLDTRVTRALLDPGTGTTLETSTTGYVPPPSVKRLVRLRDTRCRMWGCDRPAARSDLDHATPWPDGETAAGNLAVLCRHHHRVKHAPGWSYTLDAAGRAEWVSPAGARRITWPTDHAAHDAVAPVLADTAEVALLEEVALPDPAPASAPPF